MTAAVTKLTQHIGNIDNYSTGQQTDTKGVTITKGSKRTVLISKLMKVASGLVSLGNNTSNFTLAGQAKVNKSELEKMPDTLLRDKASSIRGLGSANSLALVGYNVAALDITALTTATDDFNTDIQKPKNTIGSKKTSTTQLKNEFVLASKHLDTVLDPLVRTYNESNNTFVTTYFNSRVIFDIGSQNLPLRFIVDDSINHLPIGNVQIVLNDAGNTKKKTTDKGNAQVKTLAGGTYIATLSKAGWIMQTKTINITDGETTTVVVSLVAA